MKCPAILKRKKPCGAELLTKRTLANGKEVRRERYCPRCKNRFTTIERFEIDIKAMDLAYTTQFEKIAAARDEMELRIMEYNNVLIGFKSLIDKAGKK